MAKKKETKNKKEININLSCDEDITRCCKSKDFKHKCYKTHKGSTGAFYFLGFLGAFIYYLMTTTGFWNGVLGFLKSLVWPAFLVFELFMFIGI